MRPYFLPRDFHVTGQNGVLRVLSRRAGDGVHGAGELLIAVDSSLANPTLLGDGFPCSNVAILATFLSGLWAGFF